MTMTMIMIMIMMQVISSIQSSLASSSLAPGECVRLMYPLGKMLSLLSPHEILPRLEPVLTSHLQVLDTISKAAPDQNGQFQNSVVMMFCNILFSRQDAGPVHTEVTHHVVHNS